LHWGLEHVTMCLQRELCRLLINFKRKRHFQHDKEQRAVSVQKPNYCLLLCVFS